MRLYIFIAVVVCGVTCATVYAYPPIYSNEPPAVNDSGGHDDDGDGDAIPQFNFANAQLEHQQRVHSKKPMAEVKTSTSQSPAAEAISATTAANLPTLQSAYVYSAPLPSEANKVVNAAKLSSSAAAAMPSFQTDFAGPNDNVEMYTDSSRKNIGSSAPSSISVVLNGNEPEFTDALGQKVPKPMPSLQVASPIDLLNPDRYEFFTFDENGELVKRLMTVEEIQSIVANGDGEGPTIIHHGPLEDRDPEKNVQDIVNSVQDVLNKEVESNKNSSTNILPVLDTPDVSSSWSMILPAIFGNTGSVDIFTHQKPQQIVMTPDTEIIESSTKAQTTSATKKQKPNRRKPGQKRKPSVTTTATEVTPQVIQEELESHESVYTGMQQYQHLAATMQNYDGFSQLHLQPMYHHLPDQSQVETTTKQVSTVSQLMSQKENNGVENLSDILAKIPESPQQKPTSPQRLQNPTVEYTSSKRPQTTTIKIKRKPTTTTTPNSEASTKVIISTTTAKTQVSTPTEGVVITAPTEADFIAATVSPTSGPSQYPTSTLAPATTVSKKRKKKPTGQPIHPVTAQIDGAANHFTKHRKPTRNPQDTTTDLTAEGSAHQEVAQNKFQHITYHTPRPKPQKPTSSPIASTTVVISPVPISTVQTPAEPSLITESFPGYNPSNAHGPARVTEEPYFSSTTPNVPSSDGTSGYPVPVYDVMSEENSPEKEINHYKNQPLSNIPVLQHALSKPYIDQDINAMQSFDQILQSLKQPEIGAGKTDQHIQDSGKTPPISPVKYDSAENVDQLEEMANKHMIPLSSSMLAASITIMPVLETTTGYSSIIPGDSETQLHSTPQTDLQDTTMTPDDTAAVAIEEDNYKEIGANTYKPTENVFEENAATSEEIETSSKSLYEYTETATIAETTQTSVIAEDTTYLTVPQSAAMDTTTESLSELQTTTDLKEITTIPAEATEETNDKTQTRLPVSYPHHKDSAMDDDKDNYSQPILVADLKPQLNMEVLKPSEQISMSDFQTQAATVASTLVDGTNTLAVDYNIMSSNETKDEIAFLMSDVLSQISNSLGGLQSSNNTKLSQKLDISSVEKNDYQPAQTNYNEYMGSNNFKATYNDNRFSNIAKLNTSFLETPHKHTKFPLAIDSGEDKLPHENFMTVDDDNVSNKTFNIPLTDFMQLGSDDTSTESAQPTTNLSELIYSTTVSAEDEPISYEETTQGIPNLDSESENYSTELPTEKDYDISTIKSNTAEPFEIYKPTSTFKINTLSHSEEMDRGESQAMFDIDSSMETTTHINNISEEWETVTDGDERTESSENIISTTAESRDTNESEILNYTAEIQDSTVTPLEPSDTEDSTVLSLGTTEEVTEHFGTMQTTKLQEDLADTTIKIEVLTESTSEQSPEDNETSATDVKPLHVFDIATEGNISNAYAKTEIAKTNTAKITLPSPTNTNSEETAEQTENTTLKYELNEETSEEQNSTISEENETEELTDEDPYIKLGETTTKKILTDSTTETSEAFSALKLQTSADNQPQREKTSVNVTNIEVENSEHMTEHASAQTNVDGTVNESQIPSNSQQEFQELTFEDADEEDEDDQQTYQTQKIPQATSTSTPTSSTTTPKPTVLTTRRLNTLKPVSYFNKQPAFAIFSDTVEPLYNKPFQGPSHIDNVPNKATVFNIPTPQQRPMQRPPQLSNLMIASAQATRPPVKLDPSPSYSKGLEASLADLDQDILEFARLCNELAFSYWKSITSEKVSSTRSLVVSPFALTSMLSMVFLGARGSTSGEMNDVLKLDDMVTFNPHLVFKNITDSVEKATDSDIATTAFVREVFSDRANGKILQFFKEKTQQLYSGHVEEVNFHVVNDIIRRRTNLLVKRHTMGKVLEYLRTNSVWVNGPLATISANLFQTDCSQGSTHDRDGEIFFQVHPTVRQRRLVPIPAVLFKTGFTAGYEPNLDATVVAFGRIQDTTSMIYVMPGYHSSLSPSDSLDRLEKALMETAISKNAWSDLLTSVMDRPGMEVQLPRFSHRSFVNATLGLQKMGLKGLFKSDFADLGGLTGSSNRDIYLSDMIQINTFSTCGEEKIADHHHVEMYPAPPLRKRNKDVEAHQDDDFDSSEAIIDFGSLVQDSALGRGFYDDLLDPKYLELPLPLRPRQARVPDTPRLRFDKPFLYFVRHNPTGMILFMGRFNPRLLP